MRSPWMRYGVQRRYTSLRPTGTALLLQDLRKRPTNAVRLGGTDGTS